VRKADHGTEPVAAVPTIAIDAMGGDFAPGEIVAGAIQALEKAHGGVRLTLVGRDEEIRRALEPFGAKARDGLTIVHAEETVSMSDGVSVLRRKRDSSLAVAIELQRRHEADATVSAGNTGAGMALSLLTLGRIPGVSRPAIACPLPTSTGACTLLDVGANSACKPENLYEFAVMGSIHHASAYGVERPRIGLLSIGEESSKGDSLVQEAHALLAGSSLNFIGNVEGRDIFPGNVDVVVCDGFTGNVILKFAESMPRFFGGVLRQEINASIINKIGAFLMRGAFDRMKRRLDWQEFGGAPLLGIDGITIICHGRSQAKAISSAVRVAANAVRNGMNSHIKAELEKVQVHATM